MDGEQRMAGRSAAWAAPAVAFAGGAAVMWGLVVKPGSELALWLAWALVGLAAVTGYMAFAYAFGWWPAIRKSRHDANADLASEAGPVPDVDLTSEVIDDHVIIAVENHGPEADFYAQAISCEGPMGKRAAAQSWWTIPCHEDGSAAPKRLLKGARQALDFARYDKSAVEAELANGHGDADHWKFSAAPAPVGVRYYNLLRREDLEVQFFTLIVRIMNARSGDYLDQKVIVRVQQGRPVCEITPIDMSRTSHDNGIIAEKS